MKNTIKFLGIIALAAIIGFSMSACGGDDNGGGGDNGTNDTISENGEGGDSGTNDTISENGNKLSLSGRVYLRNDTETSTTYDNYSGVDITIDDGDLGGEGTVTNGNLSYSVGIPKLSQLNFGNILPEFEGREITLSNPAVKGNFISSLGIEGCEDQLHKGLYPFNLSDGSYTGTNERVIYVYVDGDVTVTGEGWEWKGTFGSSTDTYICVDFALPLKTGWNVIHVKLEYSATFTGTYQDQTSRTQIETVTITLDNPSSLRWILELHNED